MMDNKETLFMQTIMQNKGMLFKICRIYQDDADDRNDLLQEIILQLWRVFDSYRGESKITSWMYRVALNTAIVFFKKQNAGLTVNNYQPVLTSPKNHPPQAKKKYNFVFFIKRCSNWIKWKER